MDHSDHTQLHCSFQCVVPQALRPEELLQLHPDSEYAQLPSVFSECAVPRPLRPGELLELHPESFQDPYEGSTISQRHLSSDSCPKNTNRKTVAFADAVCIFPIPHHGFYDPETKESIWHGREKMREIIDRNMLEFAAEGFEWRDVTEESDMYLNSVGDFVHPVHMWKDLRNRNETPCSVTEPFDDMLPTPVPHRPKRSVDDGRRLADKDSSSEAYH